jgi:hypothetical protein
MKCKCGFNFLDENTLGAASSGKSFAVIDDESYAEFMEKEIEAYQSAEAPAIFEASRFVGSLHECPNCARVRFASPDDGPVVFYLREDSISGERVELD